MRERERGYIKREIDVARGAREAKEKLEEEKERIRQLEERVDRLEWNAHLVARSGPVQGEVSVGELVSVASSAPRSPPRK